MTPDDTRADSDADPTLMIAVTQVLSNYLRHIPVSAAALPGLIRDVARRVALQSPPSADQTPAPPKGRMPRRERPADKDPEPIAAANHVVHDDAADACEKPVADDTIDLTKVQITRLPARRARGL